MYKRRKKRSKITILILIFIILVLMVSFIFVFSSKTLSKGQTAEVTINEGSSTSQIAEKMSSAGVVENTIFFRLNVLFMGAESSLKPGDYYFEGGKSVGDYIKELCDGPDRNLPKVIVAEGMTLKNIAKAVDTATQSQISESEFISKASCASDYSNEFPFLKEVGNSSLEGFLFPKTYPITKWDSATDLIKKMLEQFKTETSNLDFSYPNNCNLSKWDAIILASIVEKESTHDVRGKVASVFYNRLNTYMPLNSDATTAYFVGHNPTAQEVHEDNAYSTYTNHGLPPTAICSPSIDSIKAICNPENTDYLYFVFKADEQGKMQYRFSKTFDEHQQAIIDLGLV